MYKLYFQTVKTWLQKVIFPRAVWLVKVSISIYIGLYRAYMYNNNNKVLISILTLKALYQELTLLLLLLQ